MSGPSLAPILIPIVGTLSLVAWLLVVFHAGRRPGGTTAPRRPVAKTAPWPRRLGGASRVPSRRIRPTGGRTR